MANGVEKGGDPANSNPAGDQPLARRASPSPLTFAKVFGRLAIQIAILSSLLARKATFLLALIWIGSPVAGLRELISATIERGQANMAMLERAVIKDNTLMPGEWYGGQLHIAPLVSQDGPKIYTISVSVGPDRHEIQIVQGGAPSS